MISFDHCIETVIETVNIELMTFDQSELITSRLDDRQDVKKILICMPIPPLQCFTLPHPQGFYVSLCWAFVGHDPCKDEGMFFFENGPIMGPGAQDLSEQERMKFSSSSDGGVVV